MSETRNYVCGYCGQEVYEINGHTYNHDSGGTGHDCADELKAERDKLLLQVGELQKEVERLKSKKCAHDIGRDFLLGNTEKRNDEIKGIKADGTWTTQDRCRRCYPNPGIEMNCAGVHGCYCGCHAENRKEECHYGWRPKSKDHDQWCPVCKAKE